MKRAPFFLLAFALFQAIPVARPGDAAAGEAVYVNEKYRFEIAYPADLFTPQGESDAGDGQRFLAEGGEMLVYAAYNVLDADIDAEYRQVLARPGLKASYRVLKKDWFAVSGIEGGRVYYRKTFLRDGAFYTVELSYDAGKKKEFDPAVTQAVKSFRAF